MTPPPPVGPGGPGTPGGPGGAGDPEDLGTVAEEAAKLLGALGEWARDQGGDWAQGAAGLADHAAASARQVRDHLDPQSWEGIATGSAECRYCPVCRTIHAVRELSPEVRAHLTTAASSLLQAAAGVMATQVPTGGAQRQGVEHIDLDGDDQGDQWADPGHPGDRWDDPGDQGVDPHDPTTPSEPSDPDPETHP